MPRLFVGVAYILMVLRGRNGAIQKVFVKFEEKFRLILLTGGTPMKYGICVVAENNQQGFEWIVSQIGAMACPISA